MKVGLELGRLVIGGTLTGQSFCIDAADGAKCLESREGLLAILDKIPGNFAQHMTGLALALPSERITPALQGWLREWTARTRLRAEEVVLVDLKDALLESWVARDRKRRHRAHSAGLLVGMVDVVFFLVQGGRIEADSVVRLEGEGIATLLASEDLSSDHLLCVLNPLSKQSRQQWSEIDAQATLWAQQLWRRICFLRDWVQDPDFPILLGGPGGPILKEYLGRSCESPLWSGENFPLEMARGAISKAFPRRRAAKATPTKSRLIVQIRDQEILEELHCLPKKVRGKVVEKALRNALLGKNRHRFLEGI